VLEGARRLRDDDARVRRKLPTSPATRRAGVPNASLLLMAKLGVVVLEWMTRLDLDATAIQCWSSLQQNYGVNCCTIMSMMSEKLMPSACEVDVAGTVAMYALQLASGTPSALVDWNNNYGDDPDKCVFFHCGNWAKAFLPSRRSRRRRSSARRWASRTPTARWPDARRAAVRSPSRGSPPTTGRGASAYVGEGRFTDDPLQTFGTRAVVEVPDLQGLMRYICRNGFEHHAR
jgi:L-fucose isomerase-like protein